MRRVSLRVFTGAVVAEREWDQFHTPRNLMLALTGEVGELAEIFQWKGEVAAGLPTFTEQERTHLGEELADVMIYLTRLAGAHARRCVCVWVCVGVRAHV